MPQVPDAPVQWDHVAGHHVEPELLNAGLHRVCILSSQYERFAALSRPSGDPWRFWFFGLKVAQASSTQNWVWEDISVGFKCDVLLLNDVLLVLNSELGVGLVFSFPLPDGLQVHLHPFHVRPRHHGFKLIPDVILRIRDVSYFLKKKRIVTLNKDDDEDNDRIK